MTGPSTMRWHPRGYGGERRSPRPGQERRLARTGRSRGRDRRRAAELAERELVRQLGEKLYGKRKEAGDD